MDSKDAREARNEYHRQYRKLNRDKTKLYNLRYWQKKAERAKESKEAGGREI